MNIRQKAKKVLQEQIDRYGQEYDDEGIEALKLAIKVLGQQPITWIVGKDNAQVAVRNMPVDMMQKMCAIIGEEEQQTCEDMREDMRDATEEERKSTKDYIDSISKPTGLQFDDIYEELDFVQPHKKISVNLHPCEDCISREDVLDLAKKGVLISNGSYESVCKAINELPPVTPKIQEWLSSFNTESATECFTAVQELREKIKTN